MNMYFYYKFIHKSIFTYFNIFYIFFFTSVLKINNKCNQISKSSLKCINFAEQVYKEKRKRIEINKKFKELVTSLKLFRF